MQKLKDFALFVTLDWCFCVFAARFTHVCWGEVVELDWLAALDGLIWLRTGHQVEVRFQIGQSNVSRLSRKCANIFGLSLARRGAEWQGASRRVV